MVNKITSSQYVEQQRRDYALYVIQNRALPALSDGLKSAGRRVLWTAKDGQKTKTASLAGAALVYHPHGLPDGAINTLTGPFNNNIPYFKGYGSFGTLLEPNEYGASRYTSVTVSKFTQDVIFKDIEIIPMISNYDDTTEEPLHFLPLVPTVLLNPIEGIALGFATNILPRCIKDIISYQLTHLRGKKIHNPLTPAFYPLDSKCHRVEHLDKGPAYYFVGSCKIVDKTTVNISKLPYGKLHSKFVKTLDELCETATIVDFIDRSRDTINIDVKFKSADLAKLNEEKLIKMFGLEVRHFDNLNVLDFSGQSIISETPQQLIKQFTDWRLGWYVNRYQRLKDLLAIDIQKYLDIKCAIENNVGGIARDIGNRALLKVRLTEFGIVYIDYIADLPVYRFTADEYNKNEKRLKEANELMDHYNQLLSDEDKRVKVYIDELQQILDNYNKGAYNGK